MTFSAIVVRVLIASPGDTERERDAIEEAIHDWNAARAPGSGVMLMPVRWETHAVPELGRDAQTVINEQIVDDVDVVVAVFNSRIGTATGRALSGTVEEVDRARAAGRYVHVYFSTGELPRDVEVDQLQAVRDLRANLDGLIGEYSDVPDLKWQVRTALDRDVAKFVRAGKPSPHTGGDGGAHLHPERRSPAARLRAGARRGGKGEAIVTVRNSGDAPAESLSVVVVSSTGRELQAHGPQNADLLDGAHQTWRIWMSLADSAPEVVRMTWIENGVAKSLDQTVSY